MSEDNLPLRPVEHEPPTTPGRNRVLRQPNQLAPAVLWSDYRLDEVLIDSPIVARSNRRVPDLVFVRLSSADASVLTRSTRTRVSSADLMVLAKSTRPRVVSADLSVLVRS